MSYLTRKQVHLDPSVVEDLERIVRSKGGRRKGYSFSHEVNVALREWGVRGVNSDKGLFVAMPQRKDGDRYRGVAHPISEMRRPGGLGGF